MLIVLTSIGVLFLDNVYHIQKVFAISRKILFTLKVVTFDALFQVSVID